MPRSLAVVLMLAASLAAPGAEGAEPRPPIVLADFEGRDYGEWTTTGTAFGPGPARGTLPGQMSVGGYLGGGLVNSFLGGDDSVGALTSPEFTLRHRFLVFLIGGGGFPGKTCLELLVDGRVVRSATGLRSPEPAPMSISGLAMPCS